MACPCRKKKPKRSHGCKKKPRRMSHGCKKKPRRMKCFRAGVKTRNAYLNFLRDFRKTHCGMTPSQIVIAGAKVWNSMDINCKYKYIAMAVKQPKRKRCPPRRRRVC